ncbi:MAG: NDP-sugar synthase [Verrucomicrobiota bacterium]|nr:NDP-sugar synthase [Verrucomicrobiota bacterium]
MRAVVIATSETPGLAIMADQTLPSLLPLIDRPLLQLTVEQIVAWGIQDIDFILHHHPDQIEQFFGSGARWGVRFHYHLVRDPTRPLSIAKAIALTQERVILLAHEQFLPCCTDLCPAPGSNRVETPSILTYPAHDGEALWTHWALIPIESWMELSPNLNIESLPDTLRPPILHRSIPEKNLLMLRNFKDMLDSQRKFLDQTAIPGGFPGSPNPEGIWFERNVEIHPTARILPPCYLGADSRIHRGAVVGPYAVIGRECLLDEHCEIANSTVMPGTYIGQNLELQDAVVRHNRLVNVRIGGVVDIEDHLLLSSLSNPVILSWVKRTASRALGILLFLCFAPLLLGRYLLTRLTQSGTWQTSRFPRLPLSTPPEQAPTLQRRLFQPLQPPKHLIRAHFWNEFLPGIIGVARGEIGLVGLPPRSLEQLHQLPDDWLEIYKQARAGLVTEALVMATTPSDPDEIYAAEAFYVATQSIKSDARILVTYTLRLACASPIHHGSSTPSHAD